MRSQSDKAHAFAALHERASAFVIPNAWDIGSLRIFERAGFEAVATTSQGYAFTIGKRDGAVGRNEMLEHVAALCAATDLPVSVDLENGYADEPEGVAEAVRLTAQAGAVGCLIEDIPWGRAGEQYDLAYATERMRAAVEAARSLPFPFVLTGRTENFLIDREDLDDTIARLRAFEEAGAQALYAPGISTEAEIRAITSATRKPLNLLMMPGMKMTLDQVSAMGVKRVSLGSGITHAAYAAAWTAAQEMRDGSFAFEERRAGLPSLAQLLAPAQ